jgi:hypothetical protein
MHSIPLSEIGVVEDAAKALCPAGGLGFLASAHKKVATLHGSILTPDFVINITR